MASLPGYGAIFWHCAADAYRLNAVSERTLTVDLGLNLDHFRSVRQKLEWPKPEQPARIPALQRRVSFYLSHSLSADVPEKLRAEIKNFKTWHHRMVQRALCFKFGEFASFLHLDEHIAERFDGDIDAFLDSRNGRKW